MNFLDLAKNRYTTKTYREQKISAEQISELKEILRLSPSSIDSQPWRFTFVSDEKVKSQLAEASFFNEQKIKEASHLVVFRVVDNLNLFEEQITAILPEGAIAYYQQIVKPKGEEVVKNWLQKQVYISLGYFLSACAALEIDSTPMEGIDTQKYDELLPIDGYKTLFAVAIGYRSVEDKNQPHISPKTRLKAEEIINEI